MGLQEGFLYQIASSGTSQVYLTKGKQGGPRDLYHK